MTTAHRLTLLRHADSDWNGPTENDRHRVLSAHGLAEAAAVGRRFAEDRLALSVVLCSPVTRTRQTWEAVRDQVAGPATAIFDENIYQAGVADLMALLRGLDESAENVLLVGHNPGISELGFALAGDGEQSALDRLAERFPAGAFAILGVGVAWRELDPGCARLESFVRPSDLGC